MSTATATRTAPGVEGAARRARRRVRSPRELVPVVLPVLGEIVIWLIAAVAFTWPLLDVLGDRLLGGGDAQYYAWLGWRVGRLIEDGNLLPFRIPDIVAPYGFDLRLGEGYLPAYVTGLWNLVTNPVAAYNLSLLTAMMLNAWGGRAVARAVSARRTVWIITAVALSTAPIFSLRLLGHQALCFVFPVSFLVAESIGVARGRHAVRPLRMGLLLFLCYLCSSYFLVAGALAAVALCITGAAVTRLWARTAVRVALAVVLCGALMAPFVVERMRFLSDERAAGSKISFELDYREFSADAAAIVAQPVRTRFEAPWAAALRAGSRSNVVETSVFPGFLLLLGLGGFVLLRSRIRAAILVVSGAIAVLALGPSLRLWGHVIPRLPVHQPAGWLPFELVRALPVVDSLRAPGRLALALPSVAGVALAVALDTALRRSAGRALRGAIVGACAVLLVLNLPVTAFTSYLGASPTVVAALGEVHRRAQPGDTLLEVPADCSGDRAGPNVALQVAAEVPMVGCQAQYLALPWWSGLSAYLGSEALASLRCNPAQLVYRALPQYPPDLIFDDARLRQLRDELGVRFFVVHRPTLAGPGCERLQRLGIGALEGAEVIGQDGDYLVLDTGPRP